MFGTKRLLFTVGLAFQAAALPASDPNGDAFECYTSIEEYFSSYREYEKPYTTSIISTEVYTETLYDPDVPMTTLCDGRARELDTHKSTVVTVTSTLDPPETTTTYFEYTGVSPTCTIAPGSACAAVESAHPDNPWCEVEPQPPRTTYVDSCADSETGLCFIYGERYQNKLYYWPVTTVSGDFCAQNGSTVFAEPTSPPEPNKATIDGYTFTSPTNYVSFPHLQGMIHGPTRHVTTCGPWRTNVVLPITESFHSGAFKDKKTWSFNFADLNTVPVEAWTKQLMCGPQHTRCTGPIFQPAYTPIIPLPTEVLNLEPEAWKAAGCVGSASSYYVQVVPLATPAPTAANKILLG